ncbi:MAG: LruC domain-containing protein [Prevotella sp.]
MNNKTARYMRAAFAAMLVATLLTACKNKDFFDKEQYENIIEDGFPVTEVDAGHLWTTLTSAVTDIYLDEEYEGDCLVEVYLSQPSTANTALLAASGTVAPGGHMRTALSFPNSQKTFYVAVTDAAKRRVVKSGSVNNGVLTQIFRGAESKSTGTYVGESVPEPPRFGIRYCFESEFPLTGDYDFNDIVLTLRPHIEGRTVRLAVTLDAVGMVAQVAAAIRVQGVGRGDVLSLTTEGDFDTNNGRPMSSFNIIDTKEMLLPDNLKHTSDLVIKLFNDAHWAMLKTLESNGNVGRAYCNTQHQGATNFTPSVEVDPITVTYCLEMASETAANRFVAEYLDAFIIESSNGSYCEVHPTIYRNCEIIYSYYNDPEAYDNRYTWALQMPSTFRYPIEGSVVGSDRKGVYTGAYQIPGHSFPEWATNQNNATDWFDYPDLWHVY